MTVLDDLEERLKGLERTRDDATEEADREQAGMREVALFRAANAQGCIGQLARPLLAEARRLEVEATA